VKRGVNISATMLRKQSTPLSLWRGSVKRERLLVEIDEMDAGDCMMRLYLEPAVSPYVSEPLSVASSRGLPDSSSQLGHIAEAQSAGFFGSGVLQC